MLIWNHQDNKIDFIRNFNISKLYPHTQYNVGAIEFLRELFANHKSLLYSERHITDVTTCVIKHCNDQTIDQYYKAKLFDFFRVLLVFNNKPIKVN